MKSMCLINVFMGQLPNYFDLWLKSCEYNSTVDFLLITDNKVSTDIPQNVKILYHDFEWVKNQIQSIFDFPINLKSPYKLCDFKPTYGEAFSDLLKGYDFWGHCDIDLIFGDIREFLTEDILELYDRILTRGHFSLYKNNKEFNSYYRVIKTNGCNDFKKVFQSADSFCFDEWGGHCGNGISEIFNRAGIKQYDEIIYADLDFLKYQFLLSQRHEKNMKRIFEYNRGKLFSYTLFNNTIQREEFMYVHFQKRCPRIIDGIDCNRFIFAPPNLFCSITGDIDNVSKIKYYTKIRHLYGAPLLFRKNQVIKKIRKLF